MSKKYVKSIEEITQSRIVIELLCIVIIYESIVNQIHDRFVDLNMLGAVRLVHSDLRIYENPLFHLDRKYLELRDIVASNVIYQPS